MMDNAEESVRVTRSLRKRLTSVERDGSRSSTPTMLKLNAITEIDSPARTLRRTRLNSVSDAAGSTPKKLEASRPSTPASVRKRTSSNASDMSSAKPKFISMLEEKENTENSSSTPGRRMTRSQSISPPQLMELPIVRKRKSMAKINSSIIEETVEEEKEKEDEANESEESAARQVAKLEAISEVDVVDVIEIMDDSKDGKNTGENYKSVVFNDSVVMDDVSVKTVYPKTPISSKGEREMDISVASSSFSEMCGTSKFKKNQTPKVTERDLEMNLDDMDISMSHSLMQQSSTPIFSIKLKRLERPPSVSKSQEVPTNTSTVETSPSKSNNDENNKSNSMMTKERESLLKMSLAHSEDVEMYELPNKSHNDDKNKSSLKECNSPLTKERRSLSKTVLTDSEHEKYDEFDNNKSSSVKKRKSWLMSSFEKHTNNSPNVRKSLSKTLLSDTELEKSETKRNNASSLMKCNSPLIKERKSPSKIVFTDSEDENDVKLDKNEKLSVRKSNSMLMSSFEKRAIFSSNERKSLTAAVRSDSEDENDVEINQSPNKSSSVRKSSSNISIKERKSLRTAVPSDSEEGNDVDVNQSPNKSLSVKKSSSNLSIKERKSLTTVVPSDSEQENEVDINQSPNKSLSVRKSSSNISIKERKSLSTTVLSESEEGNGVNQSPNKSLSPRKSSSNMSIKERKSLTTVVPSDSEQENEVDINQSPNKSLSVRKSSSNISIKERRPLSAAVPSDSEEGNDVDINQSPNKSLSVRKSSSNISIKERRSLTTAVPSDSEEGNDVDVNQSPNKSLSPRKSSSNISIKERKSLTTAVPSESGEENCVYQSPNKSSSVRKSSSNISINERKSLPKLVMSGSEKDVELAVSQKSTSSRSHQSILHDMCENSSDSDGKDDIVSLQKTPIKTPQSQKKKTPTPNKSADKSEQRSLLDFVDKDGKLLCSQKRLSLRLSDVNERQSSANNSKQNTPKKSRKSVQTVYVDDDDDAAFDTCDEVGHDAVVTEVIYLSQKDKEVAKENNDDEQIEETTQEKEKIDKTENEKNVNEEQNKLDEANIDAVVEKLHKTPEKAELSSLLMSWGMAVSGKADSKIDSIESNKKATPQKLNETSDDKMDVDLEVTLEGDKTEAVEKVNKSSEKKKRKMQLLVSDDENGSDNENMANAEENDEVEELAKNEKPYKKCSFIKDSVDEVDEDEYHYASGDSMDSEERQDIEENEIVSRGESLGSEDTDAGQEESDDYERNSFIESDEEFELLDCDEDNIEDSDSPKGKKNGFNRIVSAWSDSDDENKVRESKEDNDNDNDEVEAVFSSADEDNDKNENKVDAVFSNDEDNNVEEDKEEVISEVRKSVSKNDSGVMLKLSQSFVEVSVEAPDGKKRKRMSRSFCATDSLDSSQVVQHKHKKTKISTEEQTENETIEDKKEQNEEEKEKEEHKKEETEKDEEKEQEEEEKEQQKEEEQNQKDVEKEQEKEEEETSENGVKEADNIDRISHIRDRINQMLVAANEAKLQAKLEAKKSGKMSNSKRKKLLKKMKQSSAESEETESPASKKEETVKVKEAVQQALKASKDILLPGIDQKSKQIGHNKLKEKLKTEEPLVKISIKITPNKVTKSANNKLSTAAGQVIEKPNTPPPSKRNKRAHIEEMQLSTGTVRIEPSSPVFRAKIKKTSVGVVREEPDTPHTIGFKVRRLMDCDGSGIPEMPAVANKHGGKRKRVIEEATYSLPQPQWTSSGVFQVETEEKIVRGKKVLGTNMAANIRPKKKHHKNSNDLFGSAIENALQFKKKSLQRNDVPRETSLAVINRKKREDLQKRVYY